MFAVDLLNHFCILICNWCFFLYNFKRIKNYYYYYDRLLLYLLQNLIITFTPGWILWFICLFYITLISGPFTIFFRAHWPGRPVRFAANRQSLCWNSCTIHELFVCRWFCVVHDPKPPLHSHNWLSFGKSQDTERFLIHCERHFSSRLPSSGGTWKYAKAPSTKKILERFSTYWYAPFCPVCLGCCAVEFGNPWGTYE